MQIWGRTVSTLVFRRTMRAFSVRMRSRKLEDTCAEGAATFAYILQQRSHGIQAAYPLLALTTLCSNLQSAFT